MNTEFLNNHKGVPDSDGVNDNGPQSDLPDYVGDGPDLSKVDLTRPINNEDGTHKQEPTDVSNPKEDTKSRDSAQFNLPPREHWENRFQFLLSTIGYAVDLSNVWRFPFLCYKNGGGAFLIPYFTTLIFGAMPVFFMEMCLGQFNRCGPTAVWDKMAPMFKGIGIASCFMAYIVAFYYNVIIGWSFFYLFASFTSVLPWTTCFNPFNSGNCWQIGWDANVTNASSASDGADVDSRPPDNRTYNASVSVSSTMEYFERGMLELHHSTGLEDLGVIRWQLLLCTFLTFTVLYFCLWKGVKSTGKVVYITATLPYVIMTILLVRGVLLPGAEDGIRYFITPKIDSLRKPKVWIDAAVQIFFSVGSGFGTHIAYASYNKFHNDCKRDCIITVIVNSFTSLFSGFVIFSYLGYMALRTQKDIDKVATEGPGLVFIVYPEAIATLPGSVGWAIIFFFMLLSLGLDSAFGGLESPLTGIRDELSQLMKYKYFREVLTLIIIMSAFLFSIPCLMQGGMYVFTILDTFAAGTSIVFIVLCQVVAVSWIYGMPQFCDDVQKMTGQRPSIFWRICWKFICPSLLLVIVASSIISYQPLTYRTSVGTYVYPYYANIIGWIIGISSMILVPGYFVYKFFRLKGSCKQRLALGMSPACEHEEIIQKGYVKRFQRSHWLSL
ncbi:sodium-dependent noradrenaline transporter-like isoform X2 [Biomphalaria glabrata]|uniref:Transporter n=1 Tax=Biomphalaria glabrata TaxID=6526 RepID=A0A9W3AUZ9_BIOGL|nr:sodium-dependent noradrenaline transporter-like isoform X2 [Biomphalaria glabrata]